MTILMPATPPSSRPIITGGLFLGVAFCFFVALGTSSPPALAQGVDATLSLAQASEKKPLPGASAPSSTATKISSKPAWQELTPSQQLSLKPLAGHWSALDEARKRKWIAIAASYPSLSPAEQAKLHSRMTEWASLSRQQRNEARLNFAESKQLTPDKKTATWEAYQALSPDEKKEFAISATPKPVGAAVAAKPVPPKKLATVPLTTETPKPLPNISAAHRAVNPNTLLAHPRPPLEPASVPKH